MTALKDRLYEALTIRGIKQIELSEKTGIGKSSISQWLSGRNEPNGKNIAILSKALDVTPEWLMGYDDVEMERPSDGERSERKKTVEQKMSEMMLKKISELFKTFTFQQQVDLFEYARKKEAEHEITK